MKPITIWDLILPAIQDVFIMHMAQGSQASPTSILLIMALVNLVTIYTTSQLKGK